MSNNNTTRHPTAFAEAMGGAIGAFWTTLIFYPIDVAKIRLQAEADVVEEADGEENHEAAATRTLAANAEGDQGGAAPPKILTPRTPKAKTFIGEILIMLKEPDLWYAGLGKLP